MAELFHAFKSNEDVDKVIFFFLYISLLCAEVLLILIRNNQTIKGNKISNIEFLIN